MKERIIDFSHYSSVKIGPKIGVCVLQNGDEAREFVANGGIVIGGANNLLLSPTPPKLGILGEEFSYIFEEDGLLRVGGRTNSALLFRFAKKSGFGGLEFLRKIPGTLGGLVKMNAGVKEFCISRCVKSVVTTSGEFEADKCGFAYRKSGFDGVVLEAVFSRSVAWSETLEGALTYVRDNQPQGASFGSVFKNPPNDAAGRLIEAVGLKGFAKGGCEFSSKHANFLINRGGGVFDEALWLINEAKRRVREEFGVRLECEVIIL